MGINTSITLWINRIIMIPFLISLLFALWDSEYLIFSYLIAFPLGVFQLFSFLISVFYYSDLERRLRRYIVIYFAFVVAFFLAFYVYSTYLTSIKLDVLEKIVRFLPVILSLFWTYILESIKKEI